MGLIYEVKKARNDAIRKIREFKFDSQIDYTGNKASDTIKKYLSSERPCFIGRFGSVEIGVLRMVKREYRNKSALLLPNDQVRILNEYGGFYPVTIESMEEYYRLYIGLMADIDILGSWCPDELAFKRSLSPSIKVRLTDLEPYYHADPWSECLAGKKVLVVNPMASSIESQYSRRSTIFKDSRILPKFELITYQPVYEFYGSGRRYKSWFDALEKMRSDISRLRFDICILGCGPFGMPLASSVKKSGGKAIVLGGATQILFGVKGVRWDSNEFISKLYNENWVYPSDEETPNQNKKLENGCYWGKSSK
jgi:hypothetical protein